MNALKKELQRVNALFSKTYRSDGTPFDLYMGQDNDPFRDALANVVLLQKRHVPEEDDFIFVWVAQFCAWVEEQFWRAPDYELNGVNEIYEFLCDEIYNFSRAMTNSMSAKNYLHWMLSSKHRIDDANEIMECEKKDSIKELGALAVSLEIVETLGPVVDYFSEMGV